MSKQELKERIHTLVEQVPDDFLETVNNYLSALSKGDVVPELNSTLDAYNRELDAALARHKTGASITHEDAISIVQKRIQKYRHDH